MINLLFFVVVADVVFIMFFLVGCIAIVHVVYPVLVHLTLIIVLDSVHLTL